MPSERPIGKATRDEVSSGYGPPGTALDIFLNGGKMSVGVIGEKLMKASRRSLPLSLS
ncbi:hypothetical protein MesoLj113a_65090 [Mesorhizobium sp. 113-1-2]|uniref:hypothetical protein n=1 Tax=Mesorhizobium sp. 113-1-2 TaxID=2744515 RepID=UPI000819A239|nr:hypothetical protein [Mesorhizobium sp. 113-1-2]BAV50973.1 Uncharacterized protein MLTONO_6071 [Mesorhizobium loti]BCG75351.1 hypothetical protein MesoLj113a_65090 [Mesorhizobium sp. 113-1-2]